MLAGGERQNDVSEIVERERIGIYGGTFDPVHNAHLMVAQEAKAAAGLHRVILMPAGTPPHKEARALTRPEHRLEMARLAVAGMAGFEVSDMEIRSPGVDYTVDTLRRLKETAAGARLYFIIGGDSLMFLDQWRNPGALLSLASFVAVYRPGYAIEALERKRAEVTARFGGEIILAACPGMDISSTEIRGRVAAGLDISGFVPAAVEAYIRQHGLYREGA
jgi:nicotinate-nucleotide adenylyltransferase